jgi:spoIIIJ-associated protein
MTSELESHSQQAKVWLETLLALMGLPASAQIQVMGDGSLLPGVWLLIDPAPLTPEQRQHLLGERGATLDSIQYLLNTRLNVNADWEEHHTFIVELDGYRLRRQQELLLLSQTVAQQVRASRQPVELADLSAAERRQVHTIFQGETDLETESQGHEPDRRLVVRLR